LALIVNGRKVFDGNLNAPTTSLDKDILKESIVRGAPLPQEFSSNKTFTKLREKILQVADDNDCWTDIAAKLMTENSKTQDSASIDVKSPATRTKAQAATPAGSASSGQNKTSPGHME
jgi:hypothetical protein